MRILIAEDDFASRKAILKFLSVYGECDVTVDGMEALKNIRDIEREHNVPQSEQAKVIMTTALNEEKNVKMAFDLGCTVYCAKPIDVEKLRDILNKLGLTE